MSIAQTESALSPSAPMMAPPKYVPPRRRQQLEEERKRVEAEGSRPLQQQPLSYREHVIAVIILVHNTHTYLC